MPEDKNNDQDKQEKNEEGDAADQPTLRAYTATTAASNAVLLDLRLPASRRRRERLFQPQLTAMLCMKAAQDKQTEVVMHLDLSDLCIVQLAAHIAGAAWPGAALAVAIDITVWRVKVDPHVVTQVQRLGADPDPQAAARLQAQLDPHTLDASADLLLKLSHDRAVFTGRFRFQEGFGVSDGKRFQVHVLTGIEPSDDTVDPWRLEQLRKALQDHDVAVGNPTAAEEAAKHDMEEAVSVLCWLAGSSDPAAARAETGMPALTGMLYLVRPAQLQTPVQLANAAVVIQLAHHCAHRSGHEGFQFGSPQEAAIQAWHAAVNHTVVDQLVRAAAAPLHRYREMMGHLEQQLDRASLLASAVLIARLAELTPQMHWAGVFRYLVVAHSRSEANDSLAELSVQILLMGFEPVKQIKVIFDSQVHVAADVTSMN